MPLLTCQSGKRLRSGGRARAALAARSDGFTLVELLVTVAVAAVLLVVAVPSFKSITLSNRLNTSVNDLIGSLNTARMEAIKTNASVQFCSNSASVNTSGTLGSVCGTEAGAVVATTGVNGITGGTKVRSGPTSITGTIQFHGNVQALRYGGDGLARAVGSTALFNGTVADICTSSLSTDNHRVITMTGGSIVVTNKTSPAAGNTCP